MNKCLGFYDTQKWRLIESTIIQLTIALKQKQKAQFVDWTRTNEWNEQ